MNTDTIHEVAVRDAINGKHQAHCSCGWVSRQVWESKSLAIADANGHFVFPTLH